MPGTIKVPGLQCSASYWHPASLAGDSVHRHTPTELSLFISKLFPNKQSESLYHYWIFYYSLIRPQPFNGFSCNRQSHPSYPQIHSTSLSFTVRANTLSPKNFRLVLLVFVHFKFFLLTDLCKISISTPRAYFTFTVTKNIIKNGNRLVSCPDMSQCN